MRKALLIAALMMTTSIGIAHAGDSWSFQVNGQKVRIERPRNCTSLSCINIVAPGLNNSNSDDEPASNATVSNPPPQPNQPVATAPMQQPVQQYQQPVQQQVQQPIQQAPMQQQVVTAPAPLTAPVATVPPLPGQADANSNVTTLPAPNTVTPPALPQVAQPVQQPVQQYQQPVQQYQQPVQQVQQPMPQQQVATVQPTAPAQTVAPVVVGNGPVGVWMTEKNEGKVHVVDCGTDICGYAVEKNGADGAQVLIDMKPDGNSWHGRIHDTRGGGTYDSTIAMRGTDKMRVQGCAFGGMFCGGQTWTRVN
jgi:uncharacterized protein (DUF2147 family)